MQLPPFASLVKCIDYILLSFEVLSPKKTLVNSRFSKRPK